MLLGEIAKRVLQQKKIAFLVVLLCITGGLATPIQVHAITAYESCIIGATPALGQLGAEAFCLPMRVATSILPDIPSADKIISSIAIGITDFFLWASSGIASYISGVYHTLITSMINDPKWSITRGTLPALVTKDNPLGLTIGGIVFLISWNIVKDWANILIVLGLIAIGISTILRFRDYEAKKLLIPLIVAALLINFSVVVVGILIDTSNLVIKTLLANDIGKPDLVSVINNARQTILSNQSTNTVGYVGVGITLTLIYVLVGITLLYFIVIFIQRYIVLAILFIFSPLAFLAYVFPNTRGKFNEWWNQLIKWCFIGLASAFFLNLSMRILQVFSGLGNLALSSSEGLGSLMFYFFIVIGFLLYGLKLAKKSGGPVADMAMKFSKAAAGVVVGTTLAAATGGASLAVKMGGKGLEKAGANQVVDKIRSYRDSARDFGTRIGEATGIFSKGTLEARQKERNQKRLNTDRLKSLENITDNTKLADLYKSSGNADERAKIVEILAKRNALTSLGRKNLEGAAKEAIQKGVSASELTKSQPDLVHLDTQKINEKKAKYANMEDPATGKKYTQKKVEELALKEARREAYARMDSSDIDKMAKDDLIYLAKTDTSATGAKARERVVKEKWESDLGISNRKFGKLIRGDEDEYNSTVMKAALKNNPLLAGESKKVEEEIEKERSAAAATGTLLAADFDKKIREKAVKEQFGKITGDQLAEMGPDVQKEAAKYASSQVLERGILKASTKGKEAIEEGIIQSVVADIGKLTPEEITNKLSAIPEPRLGDAIKRISGNAIEVDGKMTTIKDALADKFLKVKDDAVIPATVKYTPEEIKETENKKAQDILDLQKKGYMSNSEFTKLNAANKVAGKPVLSYEEEYYNLAVEKRYRDQMQEKTFEVEIPKLGDTFQAPDGKLKNATEKDITRLTAEREEHIKKLQEDGQMMSESDLRLLMDKAFSKGVDPSTVVKREYQKALRKKYDQMESELSKQAVKVPTPSTMKDNNTTPEDLEKYVDKDIQKYWEKLGKDSKNRTTIEEVIKSL